MKTLVVVASLTLVSPLAGQQPGRTGPGPDEGIEEALFAPELIMRHYREISLDPAQRQVITQAIQELQTGMVELQWQVMETSQQVQDALTRTRIDEEAALALADKLFAREAAVKRANLTALIRIKNALTAEQQKQLRALRARDAHPGAGRGPGSTRRPEDSS